MHIHMQGVALLGWEPPAMTSNITAKWDGYFTVQ